MSVSVHAMTIELFVPMLTNLSKILEKSVLYAQDKKIEAGVLENLRLAPNMFALTRQVQFSCDFAKLSTARLAGIEAPSFPDTEKTLSELQERISKTIEWLKTITPAQLADAPMRHITVPLRNRTLELEGLDFLQKWVLPNFYFHVTTTYALLRSAGIEVGKQDYLGGV